MSEARYPCTCGRHLLTKAQRGRDCPADSPPSKRGRRRWPLETLTGNVILVALLSMGGFHVATATDSWWSPLVYSLFVAGTAWCGANVALLSVRPIARRDLP